MDRQITHSGEFRNARSAFVRPLILATCFTWIAELALLVFYGVLLSDEGPLLNKIIWTLGFCGIGMGLALGGLIDVFLVGRVTERVGVWSTMALTTLTLGVACNWLCMNLDRHFQYFGGAENPYLHFLPSFLASMAGGWLLGWLLFSRKGQSILDRSSLFGPAISGERMGIGNIPKADNCERLEQHN